MLWRLFYALEMNERMENFAKLMQENTSMAYYAFESPRTAVRRLSGRHFFLALSLSSCSFTYFAGVALNSSRQPLQQT